MLSNKVSEIMTTELVKAPVAATVFSVMESMVVNDVGRIIITDDEVPVGIFTEKDVLKRVVGAQIDAKSSNIRTVMTAPVRAVRDETLIVDAFARMYRGRYRHLLVRGRRGKIVGIVSMRRILNIAVELGQGISETRTIGDIATAPVVTVDESATVHAAVNLLNQQSLTAVVVTAAGKPAGIFTERDVLQRVATVEMDQDKTPVKQVMTAPLVSMARKALVRDVLAEMSRRDIRNMPVTDEANQLVGLIAMPGILQYAQAFNIDEQVRRSWQEVAKALDNDDQYTPG
ncbi:MAG TPA: CBS domain-containing protein [Candidatus Binatia bacterium]|nr:CBS domain-containing protein [Candidatus Binatia bacterium]